MLREWIEFLAVKVLRPELTSFADEGLGIAARAQRSARYWHPHQELSKNFIRTALDRGRSNEQTRVCILGAGRLLDLDIAHATSISRKLTLIDADPLATRYLKKLLRKFPVEIDVKTLELTGRVESLQTKFEALKAAEFSSPEALAQRLRQIMDEDSGAAVPLPAADCVISLNLAGQLPLLFTGIILSVIEKHFPDLVQEDESALPPFDTLNEELSKLIQREHLSAIRATPGIKSAMILSDTDFFYYEKSSAPWLCFPALFVDPEKELANFRCVRKDSWLWHVAPQGIENSDYGSIHRIGAWEFHRDTL